MSEAEVSIRGGKVNIRSLTCNLDSIKACGDLAQLQQRKSTLELLVQLRNAGIDIDPRDRNWDLNFATDQVDVSGSSISISGTSDVNVTDRASRLLGIIYGSQGQQILQRAATFELLVQLRNAGIDIDPRDRNWDLNFATDQVDVSGSSISIIGTQDVNVTDRASRLLGITYGSQNQQLQQRAITNELLVQLTNAGVEIDPRDRNWDLNFATDQVDVSGSTLTQFTPIEKAVIHNQALPAANTNWLGSDLSPTNTPTLFRTQVAVSVKGEFSAAITRGGNTQVVNFNNGIDLTANAINIFDILVHSGDTINFRYSKTSGTIQILRVQEIDAATQ